MEELAAASPFRGDQEFLHTEERVPPRETAAPNHFCESALRFLTTLFAPDDTVLFRPIETWQEQGKKRSLVDYRNTAYRRAAPVLLNQAVAKLLRQAEGQRLNLFFGVCPRFGDRGRFDLSWQIRTVRCLWADIDRISVAEALQRISGSEIPEPSIVVNSGNGAHLYWLLDTPYLIEDAGDPPAVETEWIEKPGGKKVPRKYVLEFEEKIYLDARRHEARLSPRALHMQDVLTGIARKCGADHTFDLSRLLRIPGSLNRKDQRNGREPVPTSLFKCDGTIRYPISAFERFAVPSPDTERNRQIESMPLARVRKPSPRKEDQLAERIAVCSVTAAGFRSESDYALCCFAIENGIDKEHVWGLVETVGKFAERGRGYYDRTWASAERAARTRKYHKAVGSTLPRGISEGDNSVEFHDPSPDNESNEAGQKPVIWIDKTENPLSNTLASVTDVLIKAGNCFIRSDQLVVLHSDVIATILNPQELAGLLSQHVEFRFVEKKEAHYLPLKPAYGSTWLNQRAEMSRMPEIKLFTRNPVFTTDWRLIAPGYDASSGIYYTGSIVAPGQGTRRLDELLQDFCFRDPGDRTNYIGMLITVLLITHFIGAKPAALFNGNQPGLGKSILAQILAILRDGRNVETATYNPKDEEFEKRLGAIVREGATTIIIDNARTSGRARIESACLERSITDPILSFRLLGHSASIRAENSHIFCITANTPDLSPDLISRSVVINLEYEGNPARRVFQVPDPEEFALQHRVEILGELIGMVNRWMEAGMPKASVHTRFNKRGWGNIVGGILQFNGYHDFLANSEEAATQLDQTRQNFMDLVVVMADHPQGIWTATELVELCSTRQLLVPDLGTGSSRALSTRLGTIAGRFIDEEFDMADGRKVAFRRSDNRNGRLYSVVVLDEVRNLDGFAEPVRDVAF